MSEKNDTDLKVNVTVGTDTGLTKLARLGPDVVRFGILDNYLQIYEIGRILSSCKLLKNAVTPRYLEARNRDYYHLRKRFIASILLSLRLYKNNNAMNEVSLILYILHTSVNNSMCNDKMSLYVGQRVKFSIRNGHPNKIRSN